MNFSFGKPVGNAVIGLFYALLVIIFFWVADIDMHTDLFFVAIFLAYLLSPTVD